MLRIFGAVLVAVLLSACASSLAGDYAKGKGKTLSVTKEVWAGYQEYLTLISGTNPGDFVVAAVDGVALGYTAGYCPAAGCLVMGGSRHNKLMNECRSYGPGVECILFAHSSDILVDYKIVDNVE
jgi:hypothetical protein